jgi:hypothetical protein
MKTAVEWFNEQIKLNAEFREIFKGRVSFTIGESKIEELLEQAKLIEQEQLRTMHLITWMNKDVDFDNYYFETYEDQRSNIND